MNTVKVAAAVKFSLSLCFMRALIVKILSARVYICVVFCGENAKQLSLFKPCTLNHKTGFLSTTKHFRQTLGKEEHHHDSTF